MGKACGHHKQPPAVDAPKCRDRNLSMPLEKDDQITKEESKRRRNRVTATQAENK